MRPCEFRTHSWILRVNMNILFPSPYTPERFWAFPEVPKNETHTGRSPDQREMKSLIWQFLAERWETARNCQDNHRKRCNSRRAHSGIDDQWPRLKSRNNRWSAWFCADFRHRKMNPGIPEVRHETQPGTRIPGIQDVIPRLVSRH